MTHPAEPNDREQIDHLTVATERLSEEVSGLRNALKTFATKGDVTNATESTTKQIDAAREKHLEELVALRLRIRRRTNRMFALTIALLVLAAGAVGYYNYTAHSTVHRLCEQRNKQAVETAQKTREYFAPKYEAEKSNPNVDPVLLSILQSLANSQPQTVGCGS